MLRGLHLSSRLCSCEHTELGLNLTVRRLLCVSNLSTVRRVKPLQIMTSLSSELRHPSPESLTYLSHLSPWKSTLQLTASPAALKHCARVSKQTSSPFPYPACFCFQSLYTQVLRSKAHNLSTSTTQSSINSLWCYAELKPLNAAITACLQSPPKASQSALTIFVIGSSLSLPRPLLFLCWEGDGRHLLAH